MSYEEAVIHVRSKRICINTTHFENELMALEADLQVAKQLLEHVTPLLYDVKEIQNTAEVGEGENVNLPLFKQQIRQFIIKRTKVLITFQKVEKKVSLDELPNEENSLHVILKQKLEKMKETVEA